MVMASLIFSEPICFGRNENWARLHPVPDNIRILVINLTLILHFYHRAIDLTSFSFYVCFLSIRAYLETGIGKKAKMVKEHSLKLVF